MKNIIHSQNEEVFRILGEPIRLSILRYLLKKPATISQLGDLLNHHPAKIKYHIGQLERIGLVELAYTRSVKNYKEKYYRSKSSAVFLNMPILPWPSDKGQIVILGGDGPGLEMLVNEVNRRIGDDVFCSIPSGSLDSLIYLRENYCQVAGCHLFDFETGDFNISHIRHLFAFKDIAIVTFGYRDQGLLLPPGNPKKITGFPEIIKKKCTFINRPLGSGTRLRLDLLLHQSQINMHELIGYENEVETHNEVGRYVLDGKADAGLGLAATAYHWGLDFLYLFTERYDLVMPKSIYSSHHFQILIETLRTPHLKEKIETLGGYDMTHAGEVIEI